MENNSVLNIRKANVTDAHEIAIIHVVSWQAVYRGLIPDIVFDSLLISDRETMWKKLLSQNTVVLVLESDRKIIGFCSICKSRDDDTTQNCGEISAIYLHPDYFGSGYGVFLIKAALSELKNTEFHEVTLWVLENNKIAARFYEKMGFQKTGNIMPEDFNGVILNEIQYRKTLDG